MLTGTLRKALPQASATLILAYRLNVPELETFSCRKTYLHQGIHTAMQCANKVLMIQNISDLSKVFLVFLYCLCTTNHLNCILKSRLQCWCNGENSISAEKVPGAAILTRNKLGILPEMCQNEVGQDV